MIASVVRCPSQMSFGSVGTWVPHDGARTCAARDPFCLALPRIMTGSGSVLLESSIECPLSVPVRPISSTCQGTRLVKRLMSAFSGGCVTTLRRDTRRERNDREACSLSSFIDFAAGIALWRPCVVCSRPCESAQTRVAPHALIAPISRGTPRTAMTRIIL